MDHSYEALLNMKLDYQQAAGETVDHREGIRAFFAKRAASFGDKQA